MSLVIVFAYTYGAWISRYDDDSVYAAHGKIRTAREGETERGKHREKDRKIEKKREREKETKIKI